MKNRFLSLILLSVSALSFAQRDDVYFDPSNEVVVTRKQPTYIEQQQAPAPGVNDYDAPVARSGGSYDYDDYDYYYTSRIRRFQNSNAVASSYYSPYYSDPYYYDPSMYGGFGNSGFGNSGFGNFGFGNFGFGGFNNNMFLVSPIGMGYNPFTCRPMWRPWGPTWISGSNWSGFGMSPFGYSGYSNFGHYSPMYNIGWGSPYMTGYQQGYYDAFIGNHSNNNNNNVPRPRVDPLVYRPRVPMATNTIRPGTGVSNSQINRNNGLNNTINSERPANISPQRETVRTPQERVPSTNAPSRRPVLIERETPANVRQPQIEQQRQPQMEQPQRQPQMEQPQRRQPQMEQQRQPQMEQPQQRQPQMEQPQRRQPQMEQPQRQPQMEQPQRRAQEYHAPAPSNSGGGSAPRHRGPR